MFSTGQPITTKLKKCNHEDKLFIKEDIRKLLNKQIHVIKPFYSPWRAQVLVARDRALNLEMLSTIPKLSIVILY